MIVSIHIFFIANRDDPVLTGLESEEGELSVQDNKSVESFETAAEIKSCECQKMP